MKVLVEQDGAVTTVTINRPDERNAIDPETAAALRDAFRAFDEDAEAMVAVLSLNLLSPGRVDKVSS